MLLLDSVSKNAVNDVREEQNLHKIQVNLLKTITVPIEVEARNRGADIPIGDLPEVQSTNQAICDPHLQHTILPGISPRSFKNWKPRS